MPTEDVHIPDPELLLMADGELSARRTAQVRAHLGACWNCRVRMADLEGTMVDFARANRETPDAELPPAAGPRALLSAQLAELASKPEAGSRRWFVFFPPVMRAVAICLALFFAVLIGRLVFRSMTRGTQADMSLLEHGMVPDSRFTPGATRTVTIEDLCSSAHEEVVGQVTAPLRNAVLKEYGIVNAREGEYEIDYLIAPGLGGAEDIHNLWPQPYAARTWNAYAKDALEERLHQLVCERELDLAVAQQDIARDWIAAYKKYVQTDGQLPSRANIDPLSQQEVTDIAEKLKRESPFDRMR
jgi:hypothetical protein